MMETYKTAQNTVRAFCRCWFELLDVQACEAFLCDDVNFVGTGENEIARNRTEMIAYLRKDIEELARPFRCTLEAIREQRIAGHVCNLAMNMTLQNEQYIWRLRAFFTLVLDGGEAWNIRSFHFAEPGRSQRDGEHYPQTLVVESLARQRQELLNENVPGGMMGGYIEPGFPLYFINKHMLDYLGYRQEEAFTADIDGLVINCMHPDDRERVSDEVLRSLETSGQYETEYRMRKQDGSYIQVHDVGRKVITEDGRPAVVSVCIDITLQKRLSDELLRLYNNIPGAVFRCRFDADFSVIDSNDGLYDFLGYTREEFAAMGNRMSSVIHPDDLAVMTDKLNAQLQSGNTIHNENRLICKDGSVKWISIKAQLFQEAQGAQFYCVFIDVTEEKLLQLRNRELYEQELAYFTELASAEGCIQGAANVTKDRLESYLATSAAALSSEGDSYTQTVNNLANAAAEKAIGEELRRSLSRENVLADYAAGKVDYLFTFLRRRNDGSFFWGSTKLRSYQNPETGDIMIFFYTSDVTESKLQEKLLHKVAQLDYEMLTEIDIFGDTYRVISLDGGAEPAVVTKNEFQKEVRRVAENFMDDDIKRGYLEKLDYAYMRAQLAQAPAYTFTVDMRNEQGGMKVIRLHVFYIEKALGRVCIARSDVTDVVRQEQLRREELAAALVAAKQANTAKSDFLSRMSHEIRTPMNAIIGMSAIAAQSVGNDEQVADCIAKIGISSRFLLSLINDILDMSRIESGKMLLKNEKIPMVEFINGLNAICYTQADAKGVDYECIVDPVLGDYYVGDAMKLQQVLINILSNAIKFTREGGKVTFSVEQRRKSKDAAELRFIVNDTGMGISEDYLPYIFEPFSQESTGTTALYGGTGLGLAISKNIVDLMGGRISVRSIKGIGTEFTVDVRLGISDEEEQRPRRKKHDYNFSHLKTLVVDDDVSVCESAVATLREMGVVAEWVNDGRKAIERVQALWAGGRYFDMILIDWKMPEMDGIETARRIRAIVGPAVTIIIITAYDWASIEHEAKLAGVNLLMSKPMFKSSLISAFSAALGEKEERAQQMEPCDYDFTGKRILLAEDNALNTEVAAMLLESKGFTVDTAENGLRALEMFSKAPTGYYAAILMDIRMPLMDGLVATTSIRHLSNADAATIPIVAMTANAFDSDIDQSKAAGMDAHLAKPIDPTQLFQTLYDLIYRSERDHPGCEEA